MSREKYINIRNRMHSYSRVPLAEGQEHYDQSTVRSGHRVSIDEVRAEKLPLIVNIQDRDNNYLVSENNKLIVGGTKGKNYTKILKFIESGKLEVIPGTNEEAYKIVDDSNNAYTDWIDPADAPITSNSFSEGYEIRLIASNGNVIQRDYGWDFDAFNGILHFSSRFKPGMSEWNEKGFGTPTIQGFLYIGKHVSDITTGLEDIVNDSKEEFDNAIAKSLAIQPYKFSSNLMVKLGNPYAISYTASIEKPAEREWFQTVSFIVPGYCFELSSCDTDETIITEMRHLRNGNTQIFMDLPWDINYDSPIISYQTSDENIKYPVIGVYKFIATCFKCSDGSNISIKTTYDFDMFPGTQIISDELSGIYDYLDSDQISGQISPYPVGTFVGGLPIR